MIRGLIRRALETRWIRFFFVGGINTVFGYCLFAFFLWLGLHYAVAAALATVIGVVFNFGTIGKLVFNTFEPALVFRFVAVYCVVYFVNIICIKGLLMLGINTYIAGAITTVPMGFFGYFLHKTFVFNRAADAGGSVGKGC